MASGNTVCVLGGTGFVGRHLVSRLANSGYEVVVPTRDRERCRQLLVMPNLRMISYQVLDDTVLDQLLTDCDVAINLIGILNGSETRFEQVHAKLPKRIANACERTGCRRLLHMSALNADPKNGASLYLRSKGRGEQAVHDQTGIEVTSFRPSVIFGPGDGLFRRFTKILKLTPALPLACPSARFAPVYSGDVADAFIRAIDCPSAVGQRYELCGPAIYSLREVVDYAAELAGHKRWIVNLSDSMSQRQARLMDWAFKFLPFDPPLSVDNYESLQVDSICGGTAPGLKELAIAPTSMESIMPRVFSGHRSGRQRYDSLRQSSRR